MDPLRFDAAATRAALAYPALIEALRLAFQRGAIVPARHVHAIGSSAGAPTTTPTGGSLLLMPAWREGGRLGLKTVAVFPANRKLGLPTLHSTYLLFDATTGVPLAWLDGDEITTRRTTAASALAASYLASADARRLLLVGAGRVAAQLPAAMACVRPIEHVTVWSRRPEAAEALARELVDANIAAVASRDLQHAVAQADIVSCATLSSAPLVEGAWLLPGQHLDLIGAFTPDMRESDAACFAPSRVFVDSRDALDKAGDIVEAVRAGTFTVDRLQGTLADLCRGDRAGRRGADEITLFKSVGTALEDLAAAELVFDHAGAAGADRPR